MLNREFWGCHFYYTYNLFHEEDSRTTELALNKSQSFSSKSRDSCYKCGSRVRKKIHEFKEFSCENLVSKIEYHHS